MSSRMPGKQQDVSQLYDSYYHELLAMLSIKFGLSPSDNEDIVQITFIKFAKLIATESIESPKAYLVQMAKNQALDTIRSHKRRTMLLKFANFSSNTGESDVYNPERILSAQQRLEIIEQVMQSMPDRRREFFRLSRYECLSNVEVARRTGVSEAAVRKSLAVALLEIKRAIDQKTVDSE